MFHGVFVGVGSHRDARIPNRPSSRRDADAMYAAVGALMDGEGNRHLTLLTNERATKQTISRVLLEEIPRRIAGTDTVLVYVSGTGCLELGWAGADPSMLLLSYDSNYDDLRAGSFDMVAELSGWLRRIEAGVVALIIDASFAGGSANRTFEGPSYRATLRTRSRTRPRWSTLPLGPRCALLAACGDEESADEDTVAGHGVFTLQLLHTIAEARANPSALTPAFLHADATSRLCSTGMNRQHPALAGEATTRSLFRPLGPKSLRSPPR
jgi:hypothetical protein